MTMDDLKALAKDIEKAIAMPNSWPFETRSRLAGGWDLAGFHSPQQGRSLWRGPDRLHLDVDPSAHRRLARPAARHDVGPGHRQAGRAERRLRWFRGEGLQRGHSLRVGAAQDLLTLGQDTAAIMRAGG